MRAARPFPKRGDLTNYYSSITILPNSWRITWKRKWKMRWKPFSITITITTPTRDLTQLHVGFWEGRVPPRGPISGALKPGRIEKKTGLVTYLLCMISLDGILKSPKTIYEYVASSTVMTMNNFPKAPPFSVLLIQFIPKPYKLNPQHLVIDFPGRPLYQPTSQECRLLEGYIAF